MAGTNPLSVSLHSGAGDVPSRRERAEHENADDRDPRREQHDDGPGRIDREPSRPPRRQRRHRGGVGRSPPSDRLIYPWEAPPEVGDSENADVGEEHSLRAVASVSNDLPLFVSRPRRRLAAWARAVGMASAAWQPAAGCLRWTIRCGERSLGPRMYPAVRCPPLPAIPARSGVQPGEALRVVAEHCRAQAGIEL
jgi:hypothetical protein